MDYACQRGIILKIYRIHSNRANSKHSQLNSSSYEETISWQNESTMRRQKS